MLRGQWCAIGIAAILAASASRGASPSLAAYATVDVAPVDTWAYFADITLTVGEFLRHGDTYTATYRADVFPFFFYNEHGKLKIKVADKALRELAAGKPIDFKGYALSDKGRERPVDGRVTPADAATGDIRVRLIYSSQIVFTFNTTYRLPAIAPAPAAPKRDQAQ
jgi:hypothetical protein